MIGIIASALPATNASSTSTGSTCEPDREQAHVRARGSRTAGCPAPPAPPASTTRPARCARSRATRRAARASVGTGAARRSTRCTNQSRTCPTPRTTRSDTSRIDAPVSRKIPSTPPRIAPCSSSELTARPKRIAGNASIGSTNSVAVDSSPTAVSAVLAVGAVEPRASEHLEHRRAARGGTAGERAAQRVAGELRARDVEPLVGVQRDAHQRPDAHERRRLQQEDRHEPRGEHASSWGSDPNITMSPGSTR